ncbi:MAG TPA: hypothetical protein VIC08_13740 [Cellvibrionaceae bacterium]
MKSSLRAWCALFRFLYCRTGMLFGIVLFTLLVLGAMAAHFLLGASEGMRAFYKGLYLVCVLLNLIMIVNLPTQLNLLASRKTFLLSGNSMLHGLLMVCALVLILSLALAALVYNPWEYGHHFLKTTMMIASVSLLGILLSAVTRINFLLFLFVFMTVVLGPDRVITALTYLVENFNLIVWAFMATVFLAWGLFCQRFKMLVLRKGEPSSQWGSVEFRVDSKEYLAKMSILGFIPKLKPDGEGFKNYRVLLMESSYSLGSYVLLCAAFIIPLLAAQYILYFFFDAFSGIPLYQSSGLLLVLFPAVILLFSVSNIGANLRRLWLVMPGNRQDHMQYLIQQWDSLQLLTTLVFWMPGAILLAVSGLPLLWLVAFLAFLWCGNFTLSYFMLLTRLSQASWVPVFRFVTVALCVLVGMYLWANKDFVLTAIAAAFMASSSEFIKSRLLRTWQQQNYSELKIMEMGV